MVVVLSFFYCSSRVFIAFVFHVFSVLAIMYYCGVLYFFYLHFILSRRKKDYLLTYLLTYLSIYQVAYEVGPILTLVVSQLGPLLPYAK